MKQITYKGKKYPVKYRHIREFNLTSHELYCRMQDHFKSYEELTKIDLNEIMDLISKKNLNPMGGQTISYIELEDGSQLTAVANCSKLDVYSKVIGRQISLGRLRKLLK